MRILLFFVILLLRSNCTTIEVAKEVSKASKSIKNSVQKVIKNDGFLLIDSDSNKYLIRLSSSQFFINVNDNLFLDHKNTTAQGWGYAVFGRVTEGMDTINKIKECKTSSQLGHQDVPDEDVVINTAKSIEEN